jgi:hypothetical protein
MIVKVAATLLCVTSLALGAFGCGRNTPVQAAGGHETDGPLPGEHPHAAMPGSKLSSAESDVEQAERELYQTPGGIYTAADIAANGAVLPSKRFAGIPPRHDMHPKPGDRVCPITATLANTEFRWIVGGRSYTFCCPPCIEEFVRLAKETPDAVKPPEAYVSR